MVEPSSLSRYLPKYIHPTPFLGCIGTSMEDGEQSFFRIGKSYLRNNRDINYYIGCFVTEDSVDYYSEHDEIPIYIYGAYRYMKDSSSIVRDRDGLRVHIEYVMRREMLGVVSRLREHGVEVGYGEGNNVFYLSDQCDLEMVAVDRGSGRLRKSFVELIRKESRGLGVSDGVTGKYLELVELLLSGGMNPWELDDSRLAGLYNKGKLIDLSMLELEVLIEKVRYGKYRVG